MYWISVENCWLISVKNFLTDFILNNCLTEFIWKSYYADSFGKLSDWISFKNLMMNFQFVKLSDWISVQKSLTDFILNIFPDEFHLEKFVLNSFEKLSIEFQLKNFDWIYFNNCLTEFIGKVYVLNFSLKLWWIQFKKSQTKFQLEKLSDWSFIQKISWWISFFEYAWLISLESWCTEFSLKMVDWI